LLRLRLLLQQAVLLWRAMTETVERARGALVKTVALADPRARRGAHQGRGREHAHVLGKPSMPMAVPTPLPITICECRLRCPSPSERRSGCHGREVLRRDVEPASKLTCSLRCAADADQTHQALTAIEDCGGGHVRDILRREARPASTRET
jgi:hypothetical protein